MILSSENGYVLGTGSDTYVGFQHGGASADIDSDGDIDVFITDLRSHDAPFFLINDGNGSFTLDTDRVEGLGRKAQYTAELVVVDIDVSDTDGDGDKDIVIDRTSDDRTDEWYSGYFIQLVEQVGPRRFEDRTAQLLHQNEDEDANWIVWIRMCDCDADGDVDIVVDDAARNLIWKNDGTGKFRPR